MALRLQTETPDRASPGQMLLVIHDFESRSPDELTLKKGDRIELIERDDEFGDGWYLGRHLREGKTGLFPEVYTTLPQAPTTAAQTVASDSPRSFHSQPRTGGGAQYLQSVLPAPQLDGTSQSKDSQIGSEIASHCVDPIENYQPLPEAQPLLDSTISESKTQDHTIVMKNGANGRRTGAAEQEQSKDSAVMSHTLSVIDEHITGMGSPSRDISSIEKTGANDSASEYSNPADNPFDNSLSYVAGHETEDEDQSSPTVAEVLRWSPAQVADYLGRVGVEQRHCEVFVEQEITGEVLLGMDQPTIFMKEFELGSIGRRLRTWQAIKSLQQELRAETGPQSSLASLTGDDNSLSTPPRTRTSATPTVLPRIPSVSESTDINPKSRRPQQQQQQHNQQASSHKQETHSHQSSYTPNPSPDNPRRPSAASIRELNQMRRHSSTDHGLVSVIDHATNNPSLPNPSKPPTTPHKKQSSFDRGWSMGKATSKLTLRPNSAGDALRSSPGNNPAVQAEHLRDSDDTIVAPADYDRGYFSGGEVEARKTRNLLRKRGSGGHSRNMSRTDEPRHRSFSSPFRHSRYGSADSIRDPVPIATATTPTSNPPALNGKSLMDRFRRITMNNGAGPVPPPKDGPSPTVTKLDQAAGAEDHLSPATGDVTPDRQRVLGFSESRRHSRNSMSTPKTVSIKAVSDNPLSTTKASIGSPVQSIPSPIKESAVLSPARTGSSSLSVPTSIEPESPNPERNREAPNRASTVNGNARKKSKKETSAYTRGLEKKTPQEQMADCDYSGWMKKRSSSLVGPWRKRLFVLRGQRLSYYYTEEDKREMGLIDISCYRVLPANEERITSLHAALTFAQHSPTSPKNAQTPTLAATEAAAIDEPNSPKDSWFCFKIVPPQIGLSRAISFTRPTTHYFAVDNVKEGRLWMAALKKATITREEADPIESTYRYPTISLTKAKQMKHRPPALMGSDDESEDEDGHVGGNGKAVGTAGSAVGLNIDGLEGDKVKTALGVDQSANSNARTNGAMQAGIR